MRPGYTLTDVTHPVWGGAVRMSDCSTWAAYPTVRTCPTHVFCGTLYNFSFFFLLVRATSDFFCGCTNSHWGFLHGSLGKTLGIYPVGARDIAWDLSGGRSRYRLVFIRWPLRRSPSIFGIALGVSEHVPRHFPFKIPSDLDIRSKAMERHVMKIGMAMFNFLGSGRNFCQLFHFTQILLVVFVYPIHVAEISPRFGVLVCLRLSLSVLSCKAPFLFCRVLNVFTSYSKCRPCYRLWCFYLDSQRVGSKCSVWWKFAKAFASR